MRRPPEPLADDTRLVVTGRNTEEQHGFVNPPVYHGSTVLYPDAASLKAHKARYTYGRRGSPTTDALQDALSELDGAAGTVLAPSGLAAVSCALLAFVEAGDHILVSDSVYRPTRTFCDTALARLGVAVEYYDPCIGAEIAKLLRPNTRVVFTESPGSQTFEMQDVPAIAEAAHAAGALVLMDNTWATPLYFRPIEHGADVAIQAGTKYIVGHSDVMLGVIGANAAAWPRLKAFHGSFGLHVGPDDVYLALRGLRTLGVRLERHQASALRVARWLQTRPEVARVLYPALESDPGHGLWKRDFKGASGLFGVVFRACPDRAVEAFLDSLTLFGLGYSWGGFESLAIPCDVAAYRTATCWTAEGPLIRLHIGLEDPDDLIADLNQALERISSAQAAQPVPRAWPASPRG
jgi:cystathionine beta-lyase